MVWTEWVSNSWYIAFEDSTLTITPSGIGNLIRFCLSCLCLWEFLLSNTSKLYGFTIFWFERTWRMLFQNPVVLTKFDTCIYVLFFVFVFLGFFGVFFVLCFFVFLVVVYFVGFFCFFLVVFYVVFYYIVM